MSRFALVRFVLSFGVLVSVLCLASFAQSNTPLVFVPAGQYSSSAGNAEQIAVADINHDGKPDVLILDSFSCYVAVLLGNGDGTFKSAVRFFSGPYSCTGMAVADLNGDGNLDVVTANWQSANLAKGAVSVLLGNGDGTFQAAVQYYAGGSETAYVAIADVNGDGKLDLIVTNRCSDGCGGAGSVGVLLGNGDGTFKPVVTYNSGGNLPSSVSVGDLNGDGHPDLVVTNFCVTPNACTTGQLAVLLGNGDGTFATPALYGSGGYGANVVALADLDADGKLDAIVVNTCTTYACSPVQGAVGVLMGKGDGTFQTVTSFDAGGLGAYNLTVADVNGDGKLDALVVHTCESDVDCQVGTVSILSGNGDGTFQTAVSYDSGNYQSLSVGVGDFNGDGKADFAVAGTCATRACTDSDSVVNILFNNQGHPITTTTLASSLNPAILLHKVTYTATVTKQGGGTVTGTITFKDGGSLITSVPLVNNQATYSTSYKTIASHMMTATYSGEFQVAEGSISSALTEYAVGQTITTIATSGSPSVVGQPVTFSTTVTSKKGSIPDGELVTFYDGRTVLASVPLSAGKASFTTSTLTAKTHIIKARYVGDTRFSTSSASVTQVVEP